MVHLVGIYYKEYIMMHGLLNVKFKILHIKLYMHINFLSFSNLRSTSINSHICLSGQDHQILNLTLMNLKYIFLFNYQSHKTSTCKCS